MPTFMTEPIARSLYRRMEPQTHPVGGPVTDPVPPLTYGSQFFGDYVDKLFANRAGGFKTLGMLNNASVLVVGSAFGYLMEALIDAGIADVYGVDPGGWIWDAANVDEWAPGMAERTANDWVGSGTEQAVLAALPGAPNGEKFSWVVDEDATPAHTDVELPTFYAGLEDRLKGGALGRIIHLVSPLVVEHGPGDTSQNWKTMAEWEATAPSHTWVSTRPE